MRPPRGLTPDEAQLWARVAGTVKRLHPPRHDEGDHAKHGGGGYRPEVPSTVARQAASPLHQPAAGPPPRSGEDRAFAAPRPLDRHGLDASWDKKLARAAIQPDFTLDLHGHSLDAAHARLDRGLTQAVALGARLVLLITGRPRPAEAADRGSRRGAIRAKVLDWLAAGPHASRIAAVRRAHPRHGGEGALYVVMKKPR